MIGYGVIGGNYLVILLFAATRLSKIENDQSQP